MIMRWVLAIGLVAQAATAAPTRSSSIAVGSNDSVFVVNPDANTMARLDFAGMTGGLAQEEAVGRYPRTIALAGSYVFSADQDGGSVSRRDQANLGNLQQVSLGVGCNPYGIAATPDQNAIVVTCQGTSEVVILDLSLAIQARVKLTYPNARAIAVASNGATAYVTHFLTEEPGTDGHVSVVDLANKSIAGVLVIGPDDDTCETQNSGQGVLNMLSAIAIIPDGAPAEVAGQIWVGGTLQNNLTKGLFKREATFKSIRITAIE